MTDFQFPSRHHQVQEASSEAERTALMEQRDIELEDFLARMADRMVPSGTICATIATTAPTGWLLDNQAIAGCDTKYPGLWAAAPAGWKSGIGTTNTLTIPNFANRTLLFSTATPGALAGSMTHNLTAAQLAAHQHRYDHQHYDDHTHSTGNENANHAHGFSIGTLIAGPYNDSNISSGHGGVGAGTYGGATDGINANHQHGTYGQSIGANTYTVDGTYGAGAAKTYYDGYVTAGTSAAVDHTPAHVTVRAIIKT
jgi:hypothetical protein